MISRNTYGEMPDGQEVIKFTLINERGMEMQVINYGCTITTLKVPDRTGNYGDVVLGFDTLEGYLRSGHYMGAVIGRYANRIAYGRITVDGISYSLPINQAPHHLHGGHKGFDKRIWKAQTFENNSGAGIDFFYTSKDGEEGYPGNVKITVQYFLSHENDVIMKYSAEADRKTIINFTQHSYFNLSGAGRILDHALKINSGHFLAADLSMIPTGEVRSVENTPFDFRTSKRIGRDIASTDHQLQIAHGYDHNWVLNKTGMELEHAASLHDETSGRVLEIYTTEPGLQLYTGNFLDDSVPGKNNAGYGPYSGICLETQHYPDSPNHPEFPGVLLNPQELYQSTTMWKFGNN